DERSSCRQSRYDDGDNSYRAASLASSLIWRWRQRGRSRGRSGFRLWPGRRHRNRLIALHAVALGPQQGIVLSGEARQLVVDALTVDDLGLVAVDDVASALVIRPRQGDVVGQFLA